MSKLSLWYPVKPLIVNQPFGNPDQKYTDLGLVAHNGIDLYAVHGQPVYAAHDGVCYPQVDSMGGNGVVIRTNEAFDYNGGQAYYKSIYWHFEKADAVVKTGQSVKCGDLIGYADNTGLSTGDHLHFGLKPQIWNEESWTWDNASINDGYRGAIDPWPYFNRFYAEDNSKVVSLYQGISSLLAKLIDALKTKQ